jgi:S-adenosylmethionine decarboxylase
MTSRFAPVGRHWLIEFYGAPRLSDARHIRRALRAAVAACGATLLRLQLHHFGPGRGVTGVAMLAESHISIHTWPEAEYAAIDIFLCGPSDPALALEALRAHLAPTKLRVRRFARSARRADLQTPAPA